jgi:hypothetical protein
MATTDGADNLSGKTPKVTIKGGGSVGIGTTSPLTLLHLQNGNATYTSPESTNVPNVYIYNSNSSSTSAHSILTLRTNNTGGGNPFISFDINQVRGYAMGIDNADGDKFKINVGWSTLNSDTKITLIPDGNVGIGTTAPRAKLEVSGDIYQLWADAERFIGQVYVDGTSFRNGILTNSGTRLTQIEARAGDTSGKITFLVGASEAARIIHGGNIGIGTTSPGYKLEVAGNLKITTGMLMAPVNSDLYATDGALSYYATNNGVYLNGAGANGWLRLNGSGIENDVTSINIYGSTFSSAPGQIILRTGGSSRITILSGGNVGIGTTSPSYKLDVSGTYRLGPTNGVYFQSYAYGPEINLSGLNDGGWARASRITTSDTSNTVFFGVLGNSTSLTRAYWNVGNPSDDTGYSYSTGISLLPGGNVGIGNTSPSYKLEVAGELGISYTNALSTMQGGTGYSIFRSYAGNGSSTNVVEFQIRNRADSADFATMGTYSNHDVRIRTNNTDKVTIQAGGNVGIGTTSPSVILDVVQTLSSTGWTRIVSRDASSSAAFIGVYRSSNTYSAGIFSHNSALNGWSDLWVNAHNDGSGGIGGATANKVIIAGSVGIGTTSPSGRLHVYQSAATDTYLESGTSGTTGKLIFKTSDNSDLNKYIMQEAYYMLFNGHANEGFKFRDSNGTTLMTIYGTNNTYAGRVGIGTTAPAFPLDVAGPGRFISNSASRVLYLVQDQVNAGNIIQFRNQSNADIGEIVYRNNQFYIYSNAIGGYIMYANPATGNVGIKTASISYALDVSGDIRATGDVIAYSDARVKDNVNTITDALTKVTSLRGVSYTRKDSEDKSEKVGVIAQEVLKVLPQVVQKDDNGNYSVAYGNIVGVLIEAIKELKTEVEDLKYLLSQKQN